MWNTESKHSTTAIRKKTKWENPRLLQATNVKYYYHNLNRKQQIFNNPDFKEQNNSTCMHLISSAFKYCDRLTKIWLLNFLFKACIKKETQRITHVKILKRTTVNLHTVDKMITMYSCPWNSSTVPTFMSSKSILLRRNLIFSTYKKNPKQPKNKPKPKCLREFSFTFESGLL